MAKIDAILLALSLLSGASFIESGNFRSLDAPDLAVVGDEMSAEDCAALAAEQSYMLMRMVAMEGAMWMEPSSREVEAWTARACAR